MAVETALITPIALGYVGYLAITGTATGNAPARWAC